MAQTYGATKPFVREGLGWGALCTVNGRVWCVLAIPAPILLRSEPDHLWSKLSRWSEQEARANIETRARSDILNKT